MCRQIVFPVLLVIPIPVVMPSKPSTRYSVENLNDSKRFKRPKTKGRRTIAGVVFAAIGLRSDGLGLPVSQLIMLVLAYAASWSWRHEMMPIAPKTSAFALPVIAPSPDGEEESMIYISGNRLLTVSLASGVVRPLNAHPQHSESHVSGLHIDPIRRHSFYIGIGPSVYRFNACTGVNEIIATNICVPAPMRYCFAVSGDGQTLWVSTFGGRLRHIKLCNLRRSVCKPVPNRITLDRSRRHTLKEELIYEQAGAVYRMLPKTNIRDLFTCATNLMHLECTGSGIISFMELEKPDTIFYSPRDARYCWRVFDPVTRPIEHRRTFNKPIALVVSDRMRCLFGLASDHLIRIDLPPTFFAIPFCCECDL